MPHLWRLNEEIRCDKAKERKKEDLRREDGLQMPKVRSQDSLVEKETFGLWCAEGRGP